jgi:hypothetical protein
MKYCTYLTIYSGNKLPPFYIGSTSVEKISSGYCGSVKSATYKDAWNSELICNKALFRTVILSVHKTRKEAFDRENYMHKKLRVVQNPLYINQATAAGVFGFMPKESIEKMRQVKIANGKKTGAKVSAKRNDPIWKATIGVIANQKLKLTKNDPLWIATVGLQRNKKNAETVNNEEWKQTIGVEKSKKISAAIKAMQDSPDWCIKNARRRESLKKTFSTPEWKAKQVGLNKSRASSVSKTKSDPAWKAKHYKICQHCDRLFAPNVYSRFHGENCKIMEKQ